MSVLHREYRRAIMFQIVWSKLKNKKLLSGCLLFGMVLFVALAACTPMFREGAFNLLLQNRFNQVIEAKNEYPLVYSHTELLNEKSGKLTFDEVFRNLDQYPEAWQIYTGLAQYERQEFFGFNGGRVSRSSSNDSLVMTLGCVLHMKDKIRLVDGTLWEDADSGRAGYPCMVSEKSMDTLQLSLGETMEFSEYQDTDGNPLSLWVAGVYQVDPDKGDFWVKSMDEYNRIVMIDQNALKDIMDKYTVTMMETEANWLPDYVRVKHSDIQNMLYYRDQFCETDGACYSDNYRKTLLSYLADARLLTILFWVLELPVFALLMGYIYLIASQLMESEQHEIVLFAGKGFSQPGIVGIYIRQTALLSLAALVIGLPLGVVFCRLAGAAHGFLQFSFTNMMSYRLVWQMPVYALAASVFLILFMGLISALYTRKLVNQEMVSQKAKNTLRRGRFSLGITLLLLGVSLYLLYNYRQQLDTLAQDVLTGGKLDPLIFLDIVLFLVGMAALGVSINHLLVRLVYRLGRSRWRVPSYAAFLQVIREGGRSRFLAVFLIFTLGLGIFEANAAGTINRNGADRARYDVGCDLVYQEEWNYSSYIDTEKREVIHYYVEPDYGRFQDLKTQKLAGKFTRVIRDDLAEFTGQTGEVTMMSISTKEFGQTASLKQAKGEKHWYYALNALSQEPGGVILSRNAARDLKVDVGDDISYWHSNPNYPSDESRRVSVIGKVCAIVDSWPGYDRYQYEYDDNGKLQEKEQYLLVNNYSYFVAKCGMEPYEIWMSCPKNVTQGQILQYMKKHKIQTESITSAAQELELLAASPLMQITNGLFSLSFIISMVIFCTGFLIYWMALMKDREGLYGVYRSMGMTAGELKRLLIREQLMSSGMSAVAGGVAGLLASWLFTHVFVVIYLPKRHNLPLEIYLDATDMLRLLIVVAMVIVVCLCILLGQIRRLKLTQVMKM